MKAVDYTPASTVDLVIDEAGDRQRASDGVSRFGAYLAMRLPAVLEIDPEVVVDPVRWASFAWATATTPVMSPGYVAWSGSIEDIQTGWDDGELVVESVLRADLPSGLRGWREWDRDPYGNRREPWYSDRTALTRVTFRARLAGIRLPAPPSDHGCQTEVLRSAKTAVRTLVNVIDDLLAPVVAELSSSALGSGRAV